MRKQQKQTNRHSEAIFLSIAKKISPAFAETATCRQAWSPQLGILQLWLTLHATLKSFCPKDSFGE